MFTHPLPIEAIDGSTNYNGPKFTEDVRELVDVIENTFGYSLSESDAVKNGSSIIFPQLTIMRESKWMLISMKLEGEIIIDE